MPTITGIVYFLLSLFCLVVNRTWLFGLLIFAALFGAASAVNFGLYGIQPYYIVACVFVLSRIWKQSFWQRKFKGKRLVILFGCVGIISALIYPVLYKGTLVYNPHIGLDEGFLYRYPLQFGIQNITQATYLFIDVLVVFSVVSMPECKGFKYLYNYAFYFLAGVVILQFICLQCGISFPYFIFQSNPGYAIVKINGADTAARVMGTFAEPSMAGLSLVVFYAGYCYDFFAEKISMLKFAISAFALIFVRSSSSLITMIVITFCVIAYLLFFRSKTKAKLFYLISMTVLLLGTLNIMSSTLNTIAGNFILNKRSTLSYMYRTSADSCSLQIAKDTHWIGVGLGSNRSSSLIATLLSTTGALGMIVFIFLIVRLVSNLKGNDSWLKWSLCAGFLDMSIGVSDVTMPILWVFLALACYYVKTKRKMQTNLINNKLLQVGENL